MVITEAQTRVKIEKKDQNVLVIFRSNEPTKNYEAFISKEITAKCAGKHQI